MTCVSLSFSLLGRGKKSNFSSFIGCCGLEAQLDCYPHVRLIIDLHDVVNILICLLMVNNYEKLTFPTLDRHVV